MKKDITLLILLCLNSVCIVACPERIKEFYTTYLTNVLQDDFKNTDLCKAYLTEGLIEKVDRLINATGIDPILRAQDTNRDAIETLSVEELTNDWYLVKYFWKKGDANSIIEIPLKAQDVNGVCKITYITPIWNKLQYGDELLTCKDGKIGKIDQTSPLSFLKSFYNAYVSEYCDMPEGLNAKLSSLRSRYLSNKALEQFKNAESENLKDGLAGYDRLIDNFDFDCLWCKTIQFTHLNGDDYQMTYQVAKKTYKVGITLKKKGNSFLIDGLLF